MGMSITGQVSVPVDGRTTQLNGASEVEFSDDMMQHFAETALGAMSILSILDCFPGGTAPLHILSRGQVDAMIEADSPYGYFETLEPYNCATTTYGYHFIIFVNEIVNTSGSNITSNSYKNGIKIEAGNSAWYHSEDQMILRGIVKNTNCTATKAYLENAAHTIIASANFIEDIALFATPQLLTQGVVYYTTVDKNGQSYDRTEGASSFPIETTYFFTCTAGSFNGVDNTEYTSCVESLIIENADTEEHVKVYSAFVAGKGSYSNPSFACSAIYLSLLGKSNYFDENSYEYSYEDGDVSYEHLELNKWNAVNIENIHGGEIKIIMKKGSPTFDANEVIGQPDGTGLSMEFRGYLLQVR